MNARLVRRLLAVLLLVFVPINAIAALEPWPACGTVKSKEHDFVVKIVAADLYRPWGLDFLPDDRMLVTERAGRMRIVGRDGKVSEPIGGLPPMFIEKQGQAGLHDVLVSQSFEDDRTIFFSFAHPGDDGPHTAVARGFLRDDHTLEGVRVIARLLPAVGEPFNMGSRIVQDADGMLIISIGDHNLADRAQNSNDLAGKTIRIAPDGSVPKDNPFAGQQAVSEAPRPEIYTIGHRNPQGLAVHPETGEIWLAEHGPMGGDELNRLIPGRNYGWPIISYGLTYQGEPIGIGRERSGLEQPATFWVPSIATAGIEFYTGATFDKWQSNLFVSALRGKQIVRVGLRDHVAFHWQEQIPLRCVGRIRQMRTGPDGLLYVLRDSNEGHILRLEPPDLRARAVEMDIRGSEALQQGDAGQARLLFSNAAYLGHGNAMTNLAKMLSAEDPEESRSWFERAVAIGNRFAEFELARRLEEGSFGKRDLVRARALYRRAAEQGVQDAHAPLVRLLESQGPEFWYDVDRYQHLIMAGDLDSPALKVLERQIDQEVRLEILRLIRATNDRAVP